MMNKPTMEGLLTELHDREVTMDKEQIMKEFREKFIIECTEGDVFCIDVHPRQIESFLRTALEEQEKEIRKKILKELNLIRSKVEEGTEGHFQFYVAIGKALRVVALQGRNGSE
jgi:hypothetical protein